MAIAFDAVASLSGSAVSSLTYAHTCTGSNLLLLVGVSLHDGNISIRPVTSITYNGVALTKSIAANPSSTQSTACEMWYLVAPATGAHNVVVTMPSAENFMGSGSMSFTGVAQSAPEASAAAYAATATAAATVTTLTDNAWVVDNYALEPVPTANSGQTVKWTQQGLSYQATGGSVRGPVTPAGAATNGYALSYGGNWAMCAVSIAPLGTPPVGKIIAGRQAVNRAGSF